MRQIISTIAALSLALLVACGGGAGTSNNSTPTLSSIQVSGANSSLVAGQTEQLKATGSYSNGSTQDLTNSVNWGTSSSSTATVASGGLLTAKASGQCSVSASMGTVKGAFNLTVTPALVSIAVTPSTRTLAAATSQQFIATGTYSDNSTQNLTSSVTWSSSNSAAATVSSTAPTAGLVRAIAAGNAIITATTGSISGSASVTVSSATAVSITVSPNNPTLPLGVSQQFSATATFSDASTQDVTGVATWASSSTKIATITVSGFESSTNTGTSSISATFGGVVGSTVLTVNAANLTSISIQPSNGNIAQGTKQQFSATGTFNDGSTRDITHAVVWTSSDPTVLPIGSSSGIGTGLAPGFVNVTATLGSNTASAPFNVSDATITSVVITPSSATIPIGAPKTFTAIGTFSDSSTQDITTVVAWSSDNTAVATVGSSSSNYGQATSVGTGTAHISASFSYAGANAIGSATLNVTSATLVSIAITPSNTLIAPASGVQLTATGTFSDGATLRINPTVAWSVSDNTIATVNSTGFVTGQSGGIVGVTAQQGSVSTTANVLVESAALASIQVTPASSRVPITIRTQFKATGTFTNGDVQDLTGFVTWTSSAPSAATISNAQGTAGLALGVAVGNTTISAVFAGKSGNAALTVTNATLSSIALTPGSASISTGATQQFTATGTFSDGSTFGLTTQANWDSSEPGVASVSRGLVTGLTSGTSTISASLNGVSGSAILTVQ